MDPRTHDSLHHPGHCAPKATGMPSITALFKIGSGPSSSHTMGPEKAALLFKKQCKTADRFKVVLYGSLARTGKGHQTDVVIKKVFRPVPTEILFDLDKTDLPHPNTLEFTAYKDSKELRFSRVFSVGGGAIEIEGDPSAAPKLIYGEHHYEEIAKICKSRKIRIWQYVEEKEGEEIWTYLQTIWNCMNASIHEGLQATGVLAGGLCVQRKAKHLYEQKQEGEDSETRENRLVCSYAFAVSEQNASGGRIVTAPTCGSSGVLPAVLKYIQDKKGFSDREILHALATAGIIGNLIKTNASISGAECGCQAEIGSACSMASAALAELFGMRIDQIEYAAEVALEHHLGLTCDPINGLVQIPCIERNAVAAMRALNAVNLAGFLSDTRKISFDLIVETMYETGKDLSKIYKETSEGGLAKLYRNN